MARRKKRQNEEMDYYFFQALQDKRVPLLTLDARWHELFPEHRKTGAIKSLEKRLNKLIQKQGQTNNDIKEYQKAKKILMDNIVANMTDGHETDSPIRAVKQEKNQKLINDLNQKLKEAAEMEEELPMMIDQANKELLIECMRVCYEELMDNTAEIEEIDGWIQAAREELKNQILKKQDMEMRNTQMYKYMHNLLGAQVVEIFDREHKVWKGNVEDSLLDE